MVLAAIWQFARPQLLSSRAPAARDCKNDIAAGNPIEDEVLQTIASGPPILSRGKSRVLPGGEVARDRTQLSGARR